MVRKNKLKNANSRSSSFQTLSSNSKAFINAYSNRYNLSLVMNYNFH